jgi:chorismate mutase
MDLVDRYIAAVKFWLPAHLRDDVAAELLEDIRSEIEEAEQAKGRKLTDDEIAALLKARGKPMQVAARYQPQRHLIGPELFPLYVFVLKIVAAICFVLPLVVWFARVAFDPDAPGGLTLPLNSLLSAFAVVTIVFAVIEHKGIDIAGKTDWNPKTLPPVRDPGRIRRSDSVGEIIGPMIGIGFFAAGYLSQTTYYFPGSSITVAPEWIAFWQVIVALAVGEMALGAVNLFKPYWSGPRVLAWLVLNLAKTAAFAWLFQSHIVRAMTGTPPQVFEQFRTLSDQAARYALPFFGIVAAILIVKAVWRLAITFRRPAAA